MERFAGRAAGDVLRAPFALGYPERMSELCAAAGGITLDEDLIETVLRESETALRPFVTVEESGVGFDSPAVLATATR